MKSFATLILILFFNVGFCQVNFIGYDPIVNGQSLGAINPIAVDTAGILYTVSWCTSCPDAPFYLYYFNGSDWLIADTNQSVWPATMSMFFDEDNNLWIENGGELIKWKNGVVLNQSIPSTQLGGRNLDNVKKGSNNIIWANAGFVGPGVNTYARYDGTNWTMFDSSEVGLTAYERSFYFTIDTNNYLFAVSDTTGLHKYNGTSWSVINSTNSNLPAGVRLRNIVHDSKNNLWMLGYNALSHCDFYKYDGNSFTMYPCGGVGNGINPNHLYADKDDNVWCVTGLSLIKFNGSYITIFPLPNGANFGGLGYISLHEASSTHWFSSVNGVGEIARFNENGYQTVRGKVFDDVNQNGAMDAGENALPGAMIRSSASSYTLTDSAGMYNLAYVDSNVSITIDHILKPWSVQTTLPLTYSVTPATDSTCCYNFGTYKYPNINEVSIYGFIPNARPGFQTMANVYYANGGTTLLSDTILVVHDSLLQFSSASVAPVYQGGDTIMFSYSNLAPGNNGFIDIYFNVPVTAVIGDTAHCIARIGPVSVDTLPDNNTWDMSVIVGGSYDPNEKKVTPEGAGPTGDIAGNQRLTYQVNFQNTGTDTAFTVVVTDTLSNLFDVSTFQLIAYSNPVVVELNNNVLKFTFPSILLPDSNTNEPASHGYVRFSILPKTNLTFGSQLTNKATIFFDFNTGVITNTVVNTITSPVSIKKLIADAAIAIYPNPANEYIYVKLNTASNSLKQLTITEMSGRKVISVPYYGPHVKVNCSSLENGLYILDVHDGQQSWVRKFLLHKDGD